MTEVNNPNKNYIDQLNKWTITELRHKCVADSPIVIDYKDSAVPFDIHKFIEKNYEPVEDKPGYVWFNKRAMQIINIDTLISSLEEWKSKQTSEL